MGWTLSPGLPRGLQSLNPSYFMFKKKKRRKNNGAENESMLCCANIHDQKKKYYTIACNLQNRRCKCLYIADMYDMYIY